MATPANENIILEAQKFGLGKGQYAANLVNGSQLGLGFNAKFLDAATPLAMPPAVIVVLQTPSMYNNEPEVAQLIKKVMESHAKQVSGIDFGYTLETAGQLVGHDGQEMHVPTKTKRSPVSPSFVFPEVTGNLIWNLFRQWMHDIQDPDTNASFARFGDAFKDPYMMSAYALSFVAIQFDMTHRPENIIDAAFYTNVFPTDPGGQLGIERTIGQTKGNIERTVNFQGLVQHNRVTRQLGVRIAERLQLAKVFYDKAATGTDDVSKTLDKTGLQAEVDKYLKQPALV